jgi:hypothetical protein
MNASARVKAILFDPLAEWLRIEQETGDPAFVLSHYVTWLALVPALFSFIGASIIGVAGADAAILRAPIFNGLFGAIFGFVMTCATVLVLGLIIDLLSPLFGGRRDFDSTFKLAVYSFTPVWLAGIFLVLPGSRFLVLTGLYGGYVLWLGLPRLANSSPQRALAFATLIVLVAAGLLYLSAVAQQVLFGTPGL